MLDPLSADCVLYTTRAGRRQTIRTPGRASLVAEMAVPPGRGSTTARFVRIGARDARRTLAFSSSGRFDSQHGPALESPDHPVADREVADFTLHMCGELAVDHRDIGGKLEIVD